jgi:hypothetical protein
LTDASSGVVPKSSGPSEKVTPHGTEEMIAPSRHDEEMDDEDFSSPKPWRLHLFV